MTDGRREMKNYSNNQNLKKFMTRNPLIVNENMPASKALAIMNEKKLQVCLW